MEPQTQITCPKCKGNISPIDIFCPICGKKVKENALSTSLGTQILIYAFSIVLAPLGVWPAIKYLRQSDQKAKNIGIIALILTVVSVIVMSLTAVGIINTFSSQFGSQLSIYKELNL